MTKPTACDHCGGANLYSQRIEAAYLPLLRGLGSFLQFPMIEVIVCEDCGLMQLFAEPAARKKLATHPRWRRVDGRRSLAPAAEEPGRPAT